MKDFIKTLYQWVIKHQTWLRKLIAFSILSIIFAFYLKQFYIIGFTINWQTYHFNPKPLVIVIILYALALAYSSFAWAIIMYRIAHYSNWRKSIKIFYLTLFTRNMPIKGINILGRIYLHQEKESGKAITLVTNFIELFIVVLAGAFIFLITATLFKQHQTHSIYFPLVIIGFGFILLKEILWGSVKKRFNKNGLTQT